ncbi:MAG: hypothetical protein EA427_15115 [Spirochaetaceae bacterium]|nr:MAG: hypothetical protein EA427_15115 [Spirochaetaceae bacterium]
MDLASKPDFDQAMSRVEAWFEGAIVDRVPVRFTRHNAFAEKIDSVDPGRWQSLRDRWFDVEYQIDRYLRSIRNKVFLAETFPVYWPNLGPEVYAAFHGCPLEYGETTSWSVHPVREWSDAEKLVLDRENEYFRKIEELTRAALEVCGDRFMVGYTDLHPGADCAMAWRGATQLCLDLYDAPEQVRALAERGATYFLEVYDHFDGILKSHGQLSVTWMEIPSRGKMHIPSCDLAAMISEEQFNDIALPIIRREVRHMTHNVFHVDGKGVARHLDQLLAIPEIQAYQWVQGVAEDQPIMQWVPLVRRIQEAGKSVIVDLLPRELDEFMQHVRPEGIFLCLPSASEEEERSLLKKIEKWT